MRVWTTTMRVWTLLMRMFAVWTTTIRVGVCAGVRVVDLFAGNPHSAFLFFVLLAAAAAADVSCNLYHTVP